MNIYNNKSYYYQNDLRKTVKKRRVSDGIYIWAKRYASVNSPARRHGYGYGYTSPA